MTAHEVLRNTFGYSTFRPMQETAIRRVLDGKNTLLVMPTGGGKSVCYQIPALLRPGTGIVVSPLIALMQNQVDVLRDAGVRAAALHSNLPPEEQQEIEERLRAGSLDLLYIAPERLLLPRFYKGVLREVPLALIAIDEAHCISQWGHDFRPEYQKLHRIRSAFPNVPLLAVTATADAPTREDIARQFGLDPEDLLITGFDRPNLFYEVAHDAKREHLMAFLKRQARGESGIVYCATRKRTEDLAISLERAGFDALPYHAGLLPEVRIAHQKRFLEEEGVVMVATVAFGMGIDKPNVRFVAHWDLPRSLEAYYQETGRAGRDGAPAHVWMRYSLDALSLLRHMALQSGAGEAQFQVEQQKTSALMRFAETRVCRRIEILRYFGQECVSSCGKCDVCHHPVEDWDGTQAVRMLLSAIFRTGQRFGATHLIALLRGDLTDRIREYGHHLLPTFGVGKALREDVWRSVLRQCVSAGWVQVDPERQTYYLDASCKEVLEGRLQVRLRRDLPPRKVSKPSRATPDRASAEDHHFLALRAWRLEQARARQVPPYVIFSDATLLALAASRPRTLPELHATQGIGVTKLAAYGDELLRLIRSWEDDA